MRKKKRIALLLLGIPVWLTIAALPSRAAVDWPAIPPEDLALKDNPAQPGAPAMILYRESVINSKEVRKFYEDHYYRLKIFTEAGKKYADIQVENFKGILDVLEISGRTVHPDGKVIDFDGKVLDKLIVKSGEFKVYVKAFSLPDVIPGSIIEYRYRIHRQDFDLYGAFWAVQGELFTRNGHFAYVPFARGVTVPLMWKAYLLDNIAPYKQKDGSWAMDVKDIPGVPEEDYMLPLSELRGWLEFYYSDEPYPTDPQKYWDHVARTWAAEDEKFTAARDPIQKAVSEVISPSDSAETKLRKLYARAQQVHNLDFDPGKTVQEIKREKIKINSNAADVVKNGAASGTNVNRFFVAMAQAAGFESGLAWVTGRNRGIFHAEMLNSGTLNQAIVWVHVGDKEYYLDPGTMFCPFGMLPWHESGVSGMRPTKNGPVYFVTTLSTSGNTEIQRHADLTLEADGALSGVLVVSYSGQRALTHRLDARNEDEAGRKKLITDEMKDLLPSDAKFDLESITGWDITEGNFEIRGKVRMPSITQTAGRRLLIPEGLYLAGLPSLFAPTTRQQDIYFVFPYETLDDFTIHLPDGWIPGPLPAVQKISPGSSLNYQITAEVVGKAIHVQRKMKVGDVLFPSTYYLSIRSFFRTARADDEQQLVLQAATASNNN